MKMGTAAVSAAARSIFRSTSSRGAASAAKAVRSPFRASAVKKPLSLRLFRCPAELSLCVETMQPFHTATSSALMTSMLSISRRCYNWAPDGA